VLGAKPVAAAKVEPVATTAAAKKEPTAGAKKEPAAKKEPVAKKPAAKKEESDGEPKEIKAVEPVFPETTLVLNDLKFAYLNNTDRAAAMSDLWAKFDSKGYTFWYLKYLKLKSECKEVYRTNNLLRGFLSRVEHLRKYVLGTHGIYGDEPDLEIRGVWMIRGVELMEPIK
jgi:elongation factor 1-gamma